MPKLDGFVSARRRNHAQWCEEIAGLNLPLRVYPELVGTTHAAFAFPMLLSEDSPIQRAELSARLEAQGIATRPISGSNLIRQPAFPKVVGARVEGDTPVADAVHERGFFVGQSQDFKAEHLARLVDGLRSAFR